MEIASIIIWLSWHKKPAPILVQGWRPCIYRISLSMEGNPLFPPETGNLCRVSVCLREEGAWHRDGNVINSSGYRRQ